MDVDLLCISFTLYALGCHFDLTVTVVYRGNDVSYNYQFKDYSEVSLIGPK